MQRRAPYYKVQYWRGDIQAWCDIKKTWPTAEVAAHAAMQRAEMTRVVRVDGRQSRSIFEEQR